MPQPLMQDAQAFLAAALRPGAVVPAPPRAEWSTLLAAAEEHGILSLLADSAARAAWDPELVSAMRPALAGHAAIAFVHERETRDVLRACASEGASPLLFKGAHLAYAVYASPDLRPRLDTDLLVRDDEFEPLRRALSSLGYTSVPHVTGDVAFGQFQYGRTDASGARHTIDVHRRIANPKAFADRLTYAELSDGAVNLPVLGSNAWGPAPWLALLVACLHRTAHHGTCSRLIWLYDIHLLSGRLNDRDWDRIVDAAARKGLAPVVAAGLADAATALGTPLPPNLLQRLSAHDSATDRDVLVFLEGRASPLRVAASDWRRIESWRDRLRFLREHLFPAPSYIRHRYGVTSTALLPFLYAHRIAAGAVRWVLEN
jgi:hypothetical protein